MAHLRYLQRDGVTRDEFARRWNVKKKYWDQNIGFRISVRFDNVQFRTSMIPDDYIYGIPRPLDVQCVTSSAVAIAHTGAH